MEKLRLNIDNKRYYSEDFIKGWKTGVEAQFKADVREQKPKGEWIKATGIAPPEYTGRYVCSNCGNYALMNMPYGNKQELSPFCPNCRADMRGGTENE